MTPDTKRVPVAIALLCRNGCWLVARRRKNAHLGGQWEFPGGKIEVGETPEETATRELLEECDVQARPLRRLDVVRFNYVDRCVELTPILCEWVAGEAHPVGSDECRWVTDDELRLLDMPAANAEIIAEALRSHQNEHRK